MKLNQNQSPLDDYRDFIQVALSKGKSYGEIALELGSQGVKTTRHSVRRAVKRWGLATKAKQVEAPGIEVALDSATVTSRAGPNLSDPDSLITERGLDPEDWDVETATVNEWDSPNGEPLKQLKIGLRRKRPLDLPVPARIPLDWKPPKRVSRALDKPRLVVFVGDQQAPYHNFHLHSMFCEWLADVQPDEGVLIGDTVDLPDISRHAFEPEWSASTQECIDSAGKLLYEYVRSSENTQWKKLAGNHDERLRRAIIDQIPDLYSLRRANNGEYEEPVISIAHLLRLDELGIEYVEARGNWKHGQVQISPFLAARHGWISRKGSGATALTTLEHLGYSVIVGHNHRQSIVHKTKHDIDGSLATLAAAEAGCMCRIEDGLGYTVAPDWQNGFCTATVWPDGKFKLDLATYVNNVLYWRDRRYK